MRKNIKFKIITDSCFAAFIALFLYFYYWQNSDKKVELNFSENTETENIKDGKEIDAQDNKTENIPSDITDEKEVVNKNNANIPMSAGETADAKNTEIKITNRLVDWGFQKTEARKIDTIIVHSSYDAIGNNSYDVSGTIAEYKSYGVSPHYLIDRKGSIYRLVEDKNIAYHAGESRMPDGRTGVNNFSLGVEMLTTKKDKLTDEQYTALNLLIKNLKSKYKITNILGHNQIAPGRKDDPWNFEWNKIL
ncbi:MAG TPA: hypothetical protein DCS28_02050 [Candidatus Moranbacteria bacterium]|nr:hypothetical protein [Candidatus Moranbacteria bacterium]HAT74800.1 hypothetical protein [Candidatus Moranbacteria bacterium]